MGNNLLRTDGGVELPSELCLKVVEHVKYDPESIRVLMSLSKRFRSLLLANQYSVSKILSTTQGLLLPPPLTETIDIEKEPKKLVVASSIGPSKSTYNVYTYPWLRELHFRHDISNTLVNHPIMSMIHPVDNAQPSLPPYVIQFLENRFSAFKFDTLSLLFDFSDCMAGKSTARDVRAAQIKYLEALHPTSLAAMLTIAKVFSAGYLAIEMGGAEMSPGEQSTLLREEECIFEDNLLQYGPFFVWAYVEGTSKSKAWVALKMVQGMRMMRAFETGVICGDLRPSLQSAIMKTFCKKVGCSLADAYEEMSDAVEKRLSTLSRSLTGRLE